MRASGSLAPDQLHQATAWFGRGRADRSAATSLGVSRGPVRRLYQRWRFHGRGVLVAATRGGVLLLRVQYRAGRGRGAVLPRTVGNRLVPDAVEALARTGFGGRVCGSSGHGARWSLLGSPRVPAPTTTCLDPVCSLPLPVLPPAGGVDDTLPPVGRKAVTGTLRRFGSRLLSGHPARRRRSPRARRDGRQVNARTPQGRPRTGVGPSRPGLPVPGRAAPRRGLWPRPPAPLAAQAGVAHRLRPVRKRDPSIGRGGTGG